MKKIVSIALILFFVGLIVGRVHQVEASSSVSYSVTGVFDTGGSWAGLSGTLNRGDTMSFDLSSKPEGHNFTFWIVNGVVNKNLAQGYTFNMTSSMQLQVVFTPTGK